MTVKNERKTRLLEGPWLSRFGLLQSEPAPMHERKAFTSGRRAFSYRRRTESPPRRSASKPACHLKAERKLLDGVITGRQMPPATRSKPITEQPFIFSSFPEDPKS